MGVIKRNKAVRFNSNDDAEPVDSNNASNISFNRFLNSNPMSNTEPDNLINPVISSEDEQQTGNSNNLLELIELEIRKSKRSSTPKKRKITRAQQSFVCLGIKGKSDRKRQRYENANFISNPHLNKLINDGDIYKELDIYDFVPKTVPSPFALLLMDENYMETWDDFVNLSEDEQEQILNEYDEEVKPKNKYKNDQNLEKVSDYQSTVAQGSNRTNISKNCYDRIDNCLKSILRKKSIPLTLMESIENELIQNFKEDPTCIYLTLMESSYDRLLLHAVSQYHNLRCHSFDQKDGSGRWSKVENKLNYFEPSIVSLTSHLENLYLKSSKN